MYREPNIWMPRWEHCWSSFPVKFSLIIKAEKEMRIWRLGYLSAALSHVKSSSICKLYMLFEHISMQRLRHLEFAEN